MYRLKTQIITIKMGERGEEHGMKDASFVQGVIIVAREMIHPV